MSITSAVSLIDSYDLILLDAYGVLVTSAGVIPGAKEFVRKVRSAGKSVRVLSNDCSRTRETAQKFYVSRGFDFTVEEILNAGFAIESYFSVHGYEGKRCAVLGTEDTKECVRRAGGIPIDILKSESFDLVLIGDDSGFETLPVLNSVLSAMHARIRDGKIIRLIVANPDLLYQRAQNAFGFTSGALAHLIQLGLRELNPSAKLEVQLIGKPDSFLFRMALESTGINASRTLMIGDQLRTDILGANRAGIDACLVGTGLTLLPVSDSLSNLERPKFMVESLL
jgi:glycerol 3-phosphatase-2